MEACYMTMTSNMSLHLSAYGKKRGATFDMRPC